jgi:hypothetical protein
MTCRVLVIWPWVENKLHRNCGPEDMIATELMLKRITVDAHPGRNKHISPATSSTRIQTVISWVK